MKALLTNYHQSPRKVRLVANMIRGKSVTAARALLSFQPQKSSPALLKLLDSAVANARSTGTAPENLFVKTIAVNKGAVLKRFKPMARGRAAQFHRTMSIVSLELAPLEARTKGAAAAKGGLPLTGRGAKKATKSRAKKVAAKK
jgi:large subunit ribosomal protein L22